MSRSVAFALAFALAPAAAAQTAAPTAASDPALDPVAGRFEADLQTLARIATAAVLVHDRTGAFPTDAFGILGAPEGDATGARRVPLSALTVEAPPAGAAGAVGAFTYVPLPAPYVRDDERVRVVVLEREDGRYEAQYRITRERDADLGGGPLAYDAADGYRVRSGVGALCVEAATARALVASGTFTPDPAALSAEPLTVRVVPPGQSAPVYYEATRGGR